MGKPVILCATLTLLVLWCPFACAGTESLNPLFLLLAQKDATKYATKMAATIQDRSECQKFKVEIMSYAKGSPYDGKTVGPIVTAKQKATAAGCAK